MAGECCRCSSHQPLNMVSSFRSRTGCRALYRTRAWVDPAWDDDLLQDSHTATHGAFGIALGIGTSQVRDVLASQTLAMDPLKVRKINVNGALKKELQQDVILHVIRVLGVNGGVGYAYEYAGSTITNMTMEERMTVVT